MTSCDIDNDATDDIHDMSDQNETSVLSYEYFGDIEQLTLPWVNEPNFVPMVVVYGLTFVVGIAGNSLVIFAILGDRKNRSVTTTYLVSLAVADILFLAVCGPYETTRYFLGHWTVGRSLCKVFGFVEMLSGVTTILNLTAISTERYIAIVLPMRARMLCTRGRTVKILLLVWLLGLGAASPMLYVMLQITMYNGSIFGSVPSEHWEIFCIRSKTTPTTWKWIRHNIECLNFHNNVTSATVVMCSEVGLSNGRQFHFTIYQFVVMFAGPTLVISFCYIRVIYTLWMSAKKLSNMAPQNSYRQTHTLWNSCETVDTPSFFSYKRFKSSTFAVKTRRQEDVSAARKQVIKMLLTIIIIFLLCWGPKLIFKILRRLQFSFLYTTASHNAKIVFDCLPYVQSSANPIIYGFMSRKFRHSIKNACQTFSCKHWSSRRGRHRFTISLAESDTASPATNGLVQTTYTPSPSPSPQRTVSHVMFEERSFVTYGCHE